MVATEKGTTEIRESPAGNEPTGKDSKQAPALEETIRQAQMAGRQADPATRPEDQGLAITADQQVGDQRTEQVAGAGRDHDADERQLPLRGEGAP